MVVVVVVVVLVVVVDGGGWWWMVVVVVVVVVSAVVVMVVVSGGGAEGRGLCEGEMFQGDRGKYIRTFRALTTATTATTTTPPPPPPPPPPEPVIATTTTTRGDCFMLQRFIRDALQGTFANLYTILLFERSPACPGQCSRPAQLIRLSGSQDTAGRQGQLWGG